MEKQIPRFNEGDVVVSTVEYGKFPIGTMLRVNTSTPVYRTDSWGGRGPLTHYSFTGRKADGNGAGYSTLKSINFRLASTAEAELFREGKMTTMEPKNTAMAIENDSPVFIQEIEEVADGSGSVETKQIGEPRYFSTGKAARLFVETEIQNAVYERKFPKYALFRYHSTAQAKKPEVEYERTTF